MVRIINDMSEAETQAAHQEHLDLKAKEKTIFDALTDDQETAAREIADEWGEQNLNCDMIGEIYAAMRVREP